MSARIALVLLMALGAVLGSPAPAGAHPLGNFTVNRYARIEVSAGLVRIYYVLDLAELPAFQEREAVEADPDRFRNEQVAEIAEGLTLTADGAPLTLRAVDSSLDQPEGQAGLDTLRVAAIYEAELPTDAGGDTPIDLAFEDGNEVDRVGWREIVAVARGDAEIVTTDAPDRDLSDELRSYPGDLLQAPLDLRSVTLAFTPGSDAVSALPVPESAPPPNRSGGTFASLITKDNVGLGALLGLLGAAFLLGSGHALLPGHGKTVMGAYLVGTKGRPVDALLLGLIVSAMHTFSVLVLGLILFRVNRSFALENIFPALTIASGALAMLFGLWLLRGRLRHLRDVRAAHDLAHAEDDVHVHEPEPAAAAAIHEHDHGHDHAHNHGHEHDHDHDHDLGHEHGHDREPARAHAHEHDERELVLTGAAAPRHEHHDHEPPAKPKKTKRLTLGTGHDHLHHHGPGGHTHELPEDVAPLTRRGLVVIATSGGIVPSPSAVVVVVSAFSLGRSALGLSLIAAFSVGLAATLTGIGLGLVYGRNVIEKRWSLRSLQVLPVIGALSLIGLGLALAGRGFFEL